MRLQQSYDGAERSQLSTNGGRGREYRSKFIRRNHSHSNAEAQIIRAIRLSKTHRPNVVLAICSLSLFLATIDITIVNVALPSIRQEFGASMAGLQWSIDAYTIVGASFLMLAGSIADRIGRKTMFQIGLAIFSLGSYLCSISSTTTQLVLCRAIQAIGGAMLNPIALSIIANAFTDPRARARAIGLWASVAGISMAVGPLLGGWLTQNIGWGSIFWVNVPVGLGACILTAQFVPQSRAENPRRFDPVGQALMVVVLAAMISWLIEGAALGWRSVPIIGVFGMFAAAAVTLVVYERKRAEPLIDIRFFRSIRFSSATIMATLASLAFTGFLFLSSLYLQEVRGFSPTQTGFCLLPMAMTMILSAPIAGRLVGSGRARLAMILAATAIVGSALLLVNVGQESDIKTLLWAYALFGTGFGAINTPIMNAIVSSMPKAHSGFAAAFGATSRQVGASLGVALAGSFVGATNQSNFTSASQGFWWVIAGAGCAIIGLSIFSTGERARLDDLKVARILLG